MFRALYLLATLLLPLQAYAVDYWTEVQQTSIGGVTTKQFLGEASTKDWAGMFQITTDAYSQFRIGPRLTNEWLDVTMGVGAESLGGSYGIRFGGSARMSEGPLSGLIILENGPLTRSWYKGILMYQHSTHISYGLQHQKGQGSGVRLELKQGKVTLWGVFLHRGDATTQIGINVSF